MKVAQLIEFLKQQPQDAEVVVDERGTYGGYLWQITSVWSPGGGDTEVTIRAQEVHRQESEEEAVSTERDGNRTVAF